VIQTNKTAQTSSNKKYQHWPSKTGQQGKTTSIHTKNQKPEPTGSTETRTHRAKQKGKPANSNHTSNSTKIRQQNPTYITSNTNQASNSTIIKHASDSTT
jgi:hypothetical protein